MSGRACSGGKHWPPTTGGSCACGMITRIPAVRAEPEVSLRDLLAASLDGSVDPGQVADRLTAAMAAARLTLARAAVAR
ncbi:hypothetical protein ACI782_02045 [Geodermatophilus sp. SYSU D00703]